MSWASLLPEHLSVYEVWIARVFIFLGLLTIGPWAALIIYDFCLYCWRTALHEIPVIGGRALGRERPRAPSLSTRTDGHLRRFSFASAPSLPSVSVNEDAELRIATAKQTPSGYKRRTKN